MSTLLQPKAESETPDTGTEQQVSEAQQMEAIGRLVSGVAHDFNNLLTGIVLCSDLLLAGLAKNSRLCRYAKEIRNASAQGAGMIQQLMALAKPRAAQPGLLSLNDAIAGMQTLLARLIGENIRLVTELASDLKMVRIGSAQVQQIILNLVLNARDAMPDGGQITLRTRNCQTTAGPATRVISFPNECIELEVRDTGCGMDEHTRARVFEPFFTTKPLGKGTGLGLVTVYRFVRQAGGTIELESEPGTGTRVLIRFPEANEAGQGREIHEFQEPGPISEQLPPSRAVESDHI